MKKGNDEMNIGVNHKMKKRGAVTAVHFRYVQPVGNNTVVQYGLWASVWATPLGYSVHWM